MPFGLCNAPATFQRLMDMVLKGLLWQSCLVYIDDVIIVGKTFEQHLSNLAQVFGRLGLKLQPYKCHLLQSEVRFLGHVVSTQGVSPDPEKCDKVKQWPTPTSTKEMQQLASYYRRFVKKFFIHSCPTTQAYRKAFCVSLDSSLPRCLWELKNSVSFSSHPCFTRLVTTVHPGHRCWE